MITAYKVYEKTNGGLDIILWLVPQAVEAVDNPKKKAFRYRPEERTPSAYLLQPDASHPYWRLIDYGISNKPFSPVDLYMREKNMTRDQFVMAVHELAEKYGVEDEKITKDNRPVWKDRSAREGEVDGQHVFETRDTFTESEIRYWGPNVTEEHLRTYCWKACECVGKVENGRVKERHSTENYPIFIRECNYSDDKGALHTFYKVYFPREYDKRWRFFYIGDKPKDYINGLDALQCAFRKNGGMKLPAVFITSGDSDAVNCLSMGGQAVWLNSETTEMTKKQHDILLEYAERIYYIGDVDATGKECSRRLALRYLDIYSVILPEHLMNHFHDARGGMRKDLKDFVQLFPSRENFWNLVRQARKAQFWYEEYDKDKDKTSYHILPKSLNYFLELNGYCTLADISTEKPHYIHIEGMLVKDVYPKNIKNFINTWCEEHSLTESLLNLVMRTRDLPNKDTSNMHEKDLDFTNSTSTSQLCFFRNCWVEVTANGATIHQYKELPSMNSYVWEHDIIKHDYVEHKPMFVVSQREDGSFSVTITDDANSDVLTYLQHTSRLYWRQEDEEGIPLTEEQRRDEEQCLAAKLACIGYYLHRFKNESLAWAAILQDAFLSEDEHSANGRSGKSFFLRFLKVLINTFSIDGRNAEVGKKAFFLDGVTPRTDMIDIDECAWNFIFSYFFGMITGSVHVEEKNKHQFDIPFNVAAKFIFATNYVIKNIDSSTQARLWPQLFSDYYHQMVPGKNTYKENRGIRDDFGYNLLGSDYPEEKWQADIAFAMQCLQFYLSLAPEQRKIQVPSDFIKRRTQLAVIGKTFNDWASEYYKPGSEHLDVTEEHDVVLADYKKETEDKFMSAQKFTSKLKEYCAFAPHIHCYNPGEFTEGKQDGTRIRQRRQDNGKKVNMIHVRSELWVLGQIDEPL